MITQEEKELLIKDLCSRLPYNCMVSIAEGGIDGIKWADLTLNAYLFYQIMEEDAWEYVKPYLRPMSSMTEEEREELRQEQIKDEQLFADCIKNHPEMRGLIIPHFASEWCDKNMFDHRGLKGLANEAPKCMYNNKTK